MLYARWNIVSAVILILALSGNLAFAEYSPYELCTINWGENQEEIKIHGPWLTDVNHTPEDTTDDIFEGAVGPDICLVDLNENIFINSYFVRQFKVFDNSGGLLCDLSAESPLYDPQYYYSPYGFNVDSLSRIYFISAPDLNYIPVVDLNGQLVDKLYPFGVEHPILIGNVFRSSNDVMTFWADTLHFTYANNEFEPKGSGGWLALNGRYYDARQLEQTAIEFMEYANPDYNGHPEWKETHLYDPGFEFFNANFMGVDDDMYLYLDIIGLDGPDRVQKLSLDYNLIDEVIFPEIPNKYRYTLSPFMRTDGNIYEFRCLDDGIHVIRWEEQ